MPPPLLGWEKLSETCYRAPAPFFGSFRVEARGEGRFDALWSVPGHCDTYVPGPFATAGAAMRAVEGRMAEDLSALVPRQGT